MPLGYLNWLLDCVTLLVALAVRATVPWVGVLLAYSPGRLVANTRHRRYDTDASRGKTRGPTRRYSSMRPPFLSSRRELFSASETGVDVIDLARNELLTSAPRPASHGHSPGSLEAREIAAMSDADERHRVVVVGGGFGGLQTVRSLRRAPVEVTLVDRRNFHLFQPLLYQVATGALSPAEIATPLRGCAQAAEERSRGHG